MATERFPQAGDAVLLTGIWPWAAELPVGSVGIIGGMVGQSQDSLQVTWRFSAFRGFSSFGCPEHDNRKPSYYLPGRYREDEPVYVSCSGGPGTIALPARLLTPTDRTWHARFWAWRTGPCANGGFDYYLDVPLWEWDGKGYGEMDAYGFIPDGTRCRSCGAVLGGHKNGPGDYDHPGENYLGCMTGLCDKCMMMPGFVVCTEWDGARIISYPPDCPSHRRDRQEHIAYIDCADCKGAGRIYVSRDFGSGGPYHQYCTTCCQRYYTEEHRQRWSLLRAGVKRDEYNARYVKALLRMMGVRDVAHLPYFPWSEKQQAAMEELRVHWLGEYDRAVCEVEAIISRERAELEAQHA